jgi:hypothetical protein
MAFSKQLKWCTLAAFLAVNSAFAKNVYFAGHGGYANVTDAGGGIGGGGSIGFDTGDIFGLDLTLTFSHFSNGGASFNKLNIPLALTANLFKFDDLRTYARFGGGFTALNYTKFLLDFGAGADYFVNPHVGFGLVLRYDVVFAASNETYVYIRAIFPFGFGDDIWD